MKDIRNPFAPRAQDTEDGKGVGIRIFKTVDGVEKEHWIQRDLDTAIPLANTLYDSLRGKIIGKEYEWSPSRKYLFAIRGPDADTNESLEDELPLDDRPIKSKFELPSVPCLWDDDTRRPETKPADLP